VEEPPLAATGLLLDSVYSHPVPSDVQRMKLSALDSMHDLHPPGSTNWSRVA